MGWDPSVLRKYNTTGHFRLLNQLRGELQAAPLQRQGSGGSEARSGGKERRTIRTVEVRPQAYGRFRRSAHQLATPAGGSVPSLATSTTSTDAPSSASFRDRLNAIEMR